MKSLLTTLLLTLLMSGSALADPFEDDDLLPYLGATMDGGSPDFLGPVNPNLRDGREPVWVIPGRSLDGNSDLDWQVFLGAEYPFVPDTGRIRIYGTDAYSSANLRVEVLGYPSEIGVVPGAPSIVLQSCSTAPFGTTVIDIPRDDLRTFYRVRNCVNAPDVNYEFEYRFTQDSFGFRLSSVYGSVLDQRNGRPIAGAFVYSNDNTTTFSNLEDGTFEMLVVSDTNVVLDFVSRDSESVGSVSIGPVPFETFVEDVVLLGQPAGLVFFSGFE
ncbi:MAG: hypothetical protein QNJ40_02330 [Xanthomonadales bacterium]|nr:hypothetical protein [Xanthomonadales bacterium]